MGIEMSNECKIHILRSGNIVTLEPTLNGYLLYGNFTANRISLICIRKGLSEGVYCPITTIVGG